VRFYFMNARRILWTRSKCFLFCRVLLRLQQMRLMSPASRWTMRRAVTTGRKLPALDFLLRVLRDTSCNVQERLFVAFSRRMTKDWPQARLQRAQGGLHGHGPRYCALIRLQSVNRTWT